MKRLVTLLFFLISSVSLFGFDVGKVSLITDSALKDQTLTVALRFELEEGWHTYYKEPGGPGYGAKIKWHLPEGATVGAISWPSPKPFKSNGFQYQGYEKSLILQATINLASPVSNYGDITAAVDWLVCRDTTCLPRSDTVVLQKHAGFTEVSQQQSSLWYLLSIIIFAFLGGLLLNIMPCVFPVLAIKVMEVVSLGDKNQSPYFHYGLAYLLGVLVSFWGLYAALMVLKAVGYELGWGFHLQSPVMVVGLILLLCVMSLSFWGVFEIGVNFTSLFQPKTENKGLFSSFFTGVIAVLVATPCSAPFMGTAVGVALVSGGFQSALIFTSLALGLGFPFVLLTLFPALIHRLPQPGAWMNTLRQALAFPLMLTVVWLLWVLSQQVSLSILFLLLFFLVILSFGGWVWGKGQLSVRSDFRLLGLLVMFISIALALMFSFKGLQKGQEWHSYEKATMSAYEMQGQPFFVKFTAAWCLSCQVNEQRSFQSGEVMKIFGQLGIVPIVADWTNHDETITQLLHRFGRQSIPYYLYFDGQQFHSLPEIISEKKVMQFLQDHPVR